MALVLIAEDEPDVAHLIAMHVANSGHTVLIAADGIEALRLADTEIPDLIITDWMMTSLNGIELCKTIRASADPRIAKTPIIMLSGRSDEFDRYQGYQVGASDYLVKPFSSKELLYRVNQALGHASK